MVYVQLDLRPQKISQKAEKKTMKVLLLLPILFTITQALAHQILVDARLLTFDYISENLEVKLPSGQQLKLCHLSRTNVWEIAGQLRRHQYEHEKVQLDLVKCQIKQITAANDPQKARAQLRSLQKDFYNCDRGQAILVSEMVKGKEVQVNPAHLIVENHKDGNLSIATKNFLICKAKLSAQQLVHAEIALGKLLGKEVRINQSSCTVRSAENIRFLKEEIFQWKGKVAECMSRKVDPGVEDGNREVVEKPQGRKKPREEPVSQTAIKY